VRRLSWLVLLSAAVLVGGGYAYYKLSSTGYGIGLAKKGRVLTGTGQPVAGAWVIAQWVGYAQGIHGGANKVVHAGVAVQTGTDGTYTLPAEWQKLQHALNNFPHTTGNYGFGLVVAAPGMEPDPAKSPPCTIIGNPPAPFLCPPTHATTIDGGVGDALDDVWLKPAEQPLAERAHAFMTWNNAAFVDTQAAPDLAWQGAARKAIANAQRKDLADLACAVSGELPYQIFVDAASTVAGQDAAVRFKTNVLGPDKVSPYGTDLSCHDVATKCPPVAAEKVCSALREGPPAVATKETTP